jgi:hypothetical protein
VRGGVVEHETDIGVGWDFAVEGLQELFELDRAVACVQAADDLAGGEVQRGVEARGAGSLVVVGGALGVPGSSGRIGALRSSAWIWDFSSTHRTTARSVD